MPRPQRNNRISRNGKASSRFQTGGRPERFSKKAAPAVAPAPTPKAKGPSPIPAKDPNAFPMRINKYLAMKGFSTRRGADELIARKIVTVNGRFAVIGDRIEETDIVEVRKNKLLDGYVYYACYKPSGITTLDTRKGQKGFINSLPVKNVFPVGSLDRDTSGLIIFTNDRRIIDRLESPTRAHPKQYLVETHLPFRANFESKLEAGVSLDGGPAIRCTVDMKSPTACYITINDAKNRIRQICATFGAETARLTRTAILNIQLKNMKQNGFRRIENDELAIFLKALGL